MPSEVQNKITIYDRLLTLNTIPCAYENWAPYRDALTDYINRHTDALSSAIIVGAGSCNDYNLNALAGHFSSLTLLDIDLLAMQRGIRNQEADENKFKLIQADLIGIAEDDLRRFSSDMEQIAQQGPVDLTETFLNALKLLFYNRKASAVFSGNLRFDYVICCGVHSQLLSILARIAGVFSRAGFLQQEKIDATISKMNTVLMPNVNDMLVSMAKEGLVFGFEEERTGVPGNIEGAKQALDDLFSNKNIALHDSCRLIWPFCPERQHAYKMLIVSAEKKTR